MKNCPKQWSHVDLYEQFSPYGEISSAKMSITANFESRCYGFVEFTEVESAKKAVTALDGKVFEQNDDSATEAAPSGDGGDSPEATKNTVSLQVTNFESKRQRARHGQE